MEQSRYFFFRLMKSALAELLEAVVMEWPQRAGTLVRRKVLVGLVVKGVVRGWRRVAVR